MLEREGNRGVYVEKGYEVTKLLQNPTSQPRILGDTHESELNYFFASANQKKQVRSTALLCLDVGTPCALVVSSNERKAFPERSAEVLAFLRFIAALVRCDLFDGGFIHQIRARKPELFAEPTLK